MQEPGGHSTLGSFFVVFLVFSEETYFLMLCELLEDLQVPPHDVLTFFDRTNLCLSVAFLVIARAERVVLRGRTTWKECLFRFRYPSAISRNLEMTHRFILPRRSSRPRSDQIGGVDPKKRREEFSIINVLNRRQHFMVQFAFCYIHDAHSNSRASHLHSNHTIMISSRFHHLPSLLF